MSSRDNETAQAIARAAASFDGAVFGAGLLFCTVASWVKYFAATAALRRIQAAPSPSISDLRSLLSDGPDSGKLEDKLFVVSGHVMPKGGKWPYGEALMSQGTGERAVIITETQTCLYNEWRGIFGWTFDLHAIVAKSWKEQQTTSFRSIPFVLAHDGPSPDSIYVHIKNDGSSHPLPLTTVYHQLHPIQATPYTLFQAILGNGYPVALLDEEKILPVGKEITAVGLCRYRNGSVEISPCKALPIFLSEMTKSEIESSLEARSKMTFWFGIILGLLSGGILGYAIYRNWSKYVARKERRRQELGEQENNTDDDSGEIPDGQLCVICLMRRRRSAFIPCGHHVCCLRCVRTIVLSMSPKCPVCRQSVNDSIRIYDS